MDHRKPLGIKNYGHIAHLPGSRVGPGDYTANPGQAQIATQQARDRHDHVIVQEKLDGANVGIARLNGQLLPLSRAGYLATTSPYEQHHRFHAWVMGQPERFLAILEDGERLCGEWLIQAHGTRYALPHEPFVAFDLMVETRRTPYDVFLARIAPAQLVTPAMLHRGGPLSIADALAQLLPFGFHGALDPVEGAVWRVERDAEQQPGRGGPRARVVDFLVKYVRLDKVDGGYLPEQHGGEAVWNGGLHDSTAPGAMPKDDP